MRKREPLKSPVRKIRTPGSVRGPLGNRRSYRDGIAVDVLFAFDVIIATRYYVPR